LLSAGIAAGLIPLGLHAGFWRGDAQAGSRQARGTPAPRGGSRMVVTLPEESAAAAPAPAEVRHLFRPLVTREAGAPKRNPPPKPAPRPAAAPTPAPERKPAPVLPPAAPDTPERPPLVLVGMVQIG